MNCQCDSRIRSTSVIASLLTLQSAYLMILDTPIRAAGAARPQTRAWRRLLLEANAQTANSDEIRSQLRRHLDAADRLAAKRTAPTPSLSILQTTTADWNARVEALSALRAEPHKFDMRPIAPWLIVQLNDLRSAIVVAAADAVAAAAARKLFSAESAARIFAAAASGVKVSKKVMSEARRKAAMAVLHAQMGKILHEAIVGVGDSTHASARTLAVDAMMEMVDNAAKAADVSEFVGRLLEKTAVDKNPDVRDATRKLTMAYGKRFGDEECAKVLGGLSTDAAGRLHDVKTKLDAKAVSSARGNVTKDKSEGPGERPTSGIKELIRAKRENLKKQKAASEEDGNAISSKGSHKRPSAAMRFSARNEPAKKAAGARPGKENTSTFKV